MRSGGYATAEYGGNIFVRIERGSSGSKRAD
jgi:hypothetical protein